MKCLVIGAGGVGGSLAALLALAGNEVTCVALVKLINDLSLRKYLYSFKTATSFKCFLYFCF